MKHNDDKVQIGVEICFDPKTHDTISRTPLYTKSTPELQAVRAKNIERFAHAIYPLIMKDFENENKHNNE